MANIIDLYVFAHEPIFIFLPISFLFSDVLLLPSLFLSTSFYISLRRIDWQDTLKEMRSDPLRLARSAHTLRIIMTPPAGQHTQGVNVFASIHVPAGI